MVVAVSVMVVITEMQATGNRRLVITKGLGQTTVIERYRAVRGRRPDTHERNTTATERYEPRVICYTLAANIMHLLLSPPSYRRQPAINKRQREIANVLVPVEIERGDTKGGVLPFRSVRRMPISAPTE
jgi:hypothetical protein